MFRTSLPWTDVVNFGDSLLMLPAGVARVDLHITGGPDQIHIICHGNSRGALAKVEMRVSAARFEEARRFTHDIVLPVLSWWSFHNDVALDVAAVEIVEEGTGTQQLIAGVTGRDKPLIPQQGHVSKPGHRPLLASYREGLNTTNVFYRVQCFYRVIEGARALRDRKRESVLVAGKEYRAPEERIPAEGEEISGVDPMSLDVFKPYRSWKFTRVIDDMRGTLRNAVAHLDPKSDSLVPDEFDDVVRCEKALPVMKYLARQMLREEINSDPDYESFKVP